MMPLNLNTPLFGQFFSRRVERQAPDEPPEHEAAMAQRALLAEMMSRSPEAFHSDLDITMVSDPFCGGR
ncbi:hypothetical protein [Flavimaricola marinus]|uniref:Uncharacterized protein n=1 Tax=Flavimaricola marinus TaxID=1819565 RepID=A0A238LFD2_9RHOB|nr:hypothetical protein [Flavimaricola marinus]SMY08389.1 hypothetical protein LOM8899_02540 [Flavimaricola marinus]